MKKVLCIATHGVEEIEMVTPLDLLNRAQISTTLAAINADKSLLLKGRSGISIKADTLLEEIAPNDNFTCLAKEFDALFFPGGPGTWDLLKDKRAIKIAQAFNQEKKLIAAICAAPLLLNAAGLLDGKKVSAHNCTWEEIPAANNCAPVELDGNILSSRGAGTAFEFGLTFVKALSSNSIAQKIANETMA